jgi:hypothetical protein
MSTWKHYCKLLKPKIPPPHNSPKKIFLTFSSSWKIRFLVRAHKFLFRLGQTRQDSFGQNQPRQAVEDGEDMALNGSWPVTEKRMIDKVMKAQMDRIQESVESVIRYLVKALLEPGSKASLMPDNQDRGESNYYYVMTTIWYVVKNFSMWSWEWKEEVDSWKGKGTGYLFDPTHKALPPDNWTFGSSDTDKISLLQWYHYGSILLLHEKSILPESWEGLKNLRRLEEKIFTLAKAAKISAAAKLSSRQPYEAEDEIIDRLSLFSIELGLDPRGYGQIGTVASLALKRINGRDSTRALNPGWLPRNEGGSAEGTRSTSGPWEIHALCHHSSLMVLNLEDLDSQDQDRRALWNEEIEALKRRIYLFQNAEGTLVPSWERAHAKVSLLSKSIRYLFL